ncbi:hypothetical protein AMTRI_Chr12g241700 [Amborella trichopoda]
MRGSGLVEGMEAYKPHLLLILMNLGIAGLLVLTKSALSTGMSAPVLLVYQHVVATLVLTPMAYFEREKRPPLSFKILGWACILAFLEIMVVQFLYTVSLRFISASFQSTVTNAETAVTLVLALVFGQEKLGFWRIEGQAKVLGVVTSTVGSTVMVLWTGPTILKTLHIDGGSPSLDHVTGGLMLVLAMLAESTWFLLMGPAVRMYPEGSLMAMMSCFGTIQTTIVAAITERKASSWAIDFGGGLELATILYGGALAQGLSYYALAWCIHKKGPVFTIAFSPLSIIGSCLLETILFGEPIYLGSILGAMMVVGGLYLLLWAQAKEAKAEMRRSGDGGTSTPLVA